MKQSKSQSKPSRKRSGRNTPSRILLRWHRRLGETIAVLLLVACTTGLLLNHTEGLNLRDLKIKAPWLLDWYGMQPENHPISYQTGTDTLSSLEGTLYYNGTPLIDSDSLIGTATTPDLYCAASTSELLLLSTDGQLIERLNTASLPHPTLVGIGLDHSKSIIINTPQGLYTKDADFIEWTPAENPGPITWSTPIPTSPILNDAILTAYRGQGLSLYRIILDIHSGRFFGSWGPWLTDFTAIGLLLLTASGLYYAAFLRIKQR